MGGVRSNSRPRISGSAFVMRMGRTQEISFRQQNKKRLLKKKEEKKIIKKKGNPNLTLLSDQ